MQNLKFMLLLMATMGIFSCTPKVAEKMEAKPTVDNTVVAEEPVEVLHPPVSIDGGIQMNYLYAGMPNEIKVNVQGGSSAHLVVETTNGTLAPADVSKGLYTFFYKYSGMVVEIYAKDTVNNITVAESYEVVPFPAPDAYVWTYRKPMPNKKAQEMDAITFRVQNAIVLDHSYRVPARCAPTSFKITHITSGGTKSSHLNEDSIGKFDETALAMVQAAKSGDIYIIEDIKTRCSPAPIKNIVYVLK
ncbi:MAG: hypothetical protein AB8E82_03490 [Aureispira sp.]